VGATERAFEAFDTMVRLRPDAASYARVASALELQLCARMGDTSAAQREIRLALSVFPGYPDAVALSNLAAF
jgi:hypothetical protein